MAVLGSDFVQKFGYCEMYEWSSVPENKHGLFVQFNKDNPNKIEPYNGGYLVGVSSVCALTISDDPEEWAGKYLMNAVGDYYVNREKLAVGEKVYDHVNELAYIQTKPYEHFVKIQNDAFNKDVEYVKRSSRSNWDMVNLMGKCIVRDNGKCKPGSFCKPYSGEDESLFGTAVPAQKNSTTKFYVLERLTNHSVLILNK